MRINNNIMAMNTHRQYGINNAGAARSVEKLSSGYRINRAGDDAAGLAISEKMRAQIRGLTMASKNSQDAISLVQTAEGALQETHNILQRMREISVQSASDTNETSIDRDALNKEFQALIDEIDDTAEKTKFNDMGLIDGKFAKYKASAGSGLGTAKIYGEALTIGADGTTPQTFNLDFEEIPGTAKAPTVSAITPGSSTSGISGINIVLNDWAKGTALNGETISFDFADTGSSDTSWQLKVTINSIEYISSPYDLSGSNTANLSGAITLTGGSNTITIAFSGASFDAVNKTEAVKIAADLNATTSSSINNDGVSNQVKITDEDKNEYVLEAGQTKLQLANGVSMEFDAIQANFGNVSAIFGVGSMSGGTVVTKTVSVDLEAGTDFVVQTGANKDDELKINIDKMDSKTIGVWAANVSNRADASLSILHVNNAINKVSTQRAALGALQNRLEHKIANLDTSSENLQSAESRIRDLDMAQEMTKFTKNNILSQASTAMLAQANSLPQGVLSLLR